MIAADHTNTILLTHSEQFRVKPEPRYRQWKLEEIPVGAIARRKNMHSSQIPQVIIAADIYKWRSDSGDAEMACAIMKFENSDNTRADRLMKGWEWKWAHEDAYCWQPCCAAEES
jgi:hypothetical protein